MMVRDDRVGAASMVLGVLGVLMWSVLRVLSTVLALAALVLGLVAVRRHRTGMAGTGIMLGVVTLAISVFAVVWSWLLAF